MLIETATKIRGGTPAAFEAVYQDAAGDPERIPWGDERAHPALVTWLNRVAPSLVRCGARVAVVGCGLGHDAAEVVRRGYDVTAFDCSETAVRWAKREHPSCADCFHVADLYDLPTRWRHRFDLVVEVNTIQSQLLPRRDECMRSISELLSPRGFLLVICRASDVAATDADGPPWAITRDELTAAAAAADLKPQGAIDVFDDDERVPVRRMRALFVRG